MSSSTYVRRLNGLSLAQIMACRLGGTMLSLEIKCWLIAHCTIKNKPAAMGIQNLSPNKIHLKMPNTRHCFNTGSEVNYIVAHIFWNKKENFQTDVFCSVYLPGLLLICFIQLINELPPGKSFRDSWKLWLSSPITSLYGARKYLTKSCDHILKLRGLSACIGFIGNIQTWVRRMSIDSSMPQTQTLFSHFIDVTFMLKCPCEHARTEWNLHTTALHLWYESNI